MEAHCLKRLKIQNRMNARRQRRLWSSLQEVEKNKWIRHWELNELWSLTQQQQYRSRLGVWQTQSRVRSLCRALNVPLEEASATLCSNRWRDNTPQALFTVCCLCTNIARGAVSCHNIKLHIFTLSFVLHKSSSHEFQKDSLCLSVFSLYFTTNHKSFLLKNGDVGWPVEQLGSEYTTIITGEIAGKIHVSQKMFLMISVTPWPFLLYISESSGKIAHEVGVIYSPPVDKPFLVWKWASPSHDHTCLMSPELSS